MSGGLRIAFAGTPDLAAVILASLITDGRHTIPFVYTRPDRPAGRGQKLQKSPVKELAEKNQLPVKQPLSRLELDKDRSLEQTDVMIVAAFGMIIPASVLTRPRYGCINIHTSLLPRWRGAAPIQRSILAGDTETGITIMQMDAGLDTGDILYQESCAIQPHDTTGTLQERLAQLGGHCLRVTLEQMTNNALNPIRQNEYEVTYAHKIQKSEAEINWQKPAVDIDRQIRAFNPAPVAYTVLNHKALRVWQASVLDQDTAGIVPGTIINYSAAGIDVATGNRVIRISRLQLPGKKVMTCRDFFNGNPGFWPGDNKP
jgi:methionyl-tRNA formyltransferase